MTKFQFTVTIGASAVNLAAAAFALTEGVAYPKGWTKTYGTSYLPFNRLEAYLDVGSTGTAYIGPSTVTSAGVNKDYTLAPGLSPQYGGYTLIQTYSDANVGDLSQYWVHGTNPGDTVVVVYHQI